MTYEIKDDIATILFKMDRCLTRNGVEWIAASDAPSTYKELKESYKKHNKIIIWDGASEKSIWGRMGNLLFRAFHDYIHATYDLSFLDADEREVRRVSCNLLHLSESQCRILKIEIDSQIDYKNKYGVFPEDQVAFFIKNIA